MKLTSKHWIGILLGIVVLAVDFIFLSGQRSFYFIIGIAILAAASPFVATAVLEAGREREKEEMFLEFARNLVGSVKAGTPISKSIIQLRDKEFGSLTPHIVKLANQISLGIPVRDALGTFSHDINNRVISKSITLIMEAEESGGKIDMILESTAKSVSEIEDVKKEQRTSMYNFIIQGYLIFFIFLVIMLIVQIKFVPSIVQTVSAAGISGVSGLGISGAKISIDSLNNIFLALILMQGFFAGLVIGKLSEGRIMSGLKHSLIMAAVSYLITTGIKIII